MNYRPGGRHFNYRPPLGPFRPLDRRCAGEDRPGVAAGEPVVVASQAGAGAARCAMVEWPGRGAERDAAASPTVPRMATASWQLAASIRHEQRRSFRSIAGQLRSCTVIEQLLVVAVSVATMDSDPIEASLW